MSPRMPALVALYLAASLVIAAAGCGAPPAPPVTPATPPAPAEDNLEPETDDSAMLDVISGQPTDILLDGKPIGTTPISGYKITPGSHEVTFIDPARGNRTMAVTVGPGDTKTVQSDPAPSIIEAPPADENNKK